jgi:hypothetical protein
MFFNVIRLHIQITEHNADTLRHLEAFVGIFYGKRGLRNRSASHTVQWLMQKRKIRRKW